jgi:hypothetical protein
MNDQIMLTMGGLYRYNQNNKPNEEVKQNSPDDIYSMTNYSAEYSFI